MTMTREVAQPRTEEDELPTEGWKRLKKDDVPAMQHILGVLVSFGEKVRQKATSAHLARKAVVFADSACVTFEVALMPDADRTVYLVRAKAREPQLLVETSWVHEDGIADEREVLGQDHPTHGITCLTDLYERAEVIA